MNRVELTLLMGLPWRRVGYSRRGSGQSSDPTGHDRGPGGRYGRRNLPAQFVAELDPPRRVDRKEFQGGKYLNLEPLPA